MKNLNYSSRNRGSLAALQSNDVGSDCRLTVGSPSVKYRLNLLRLVAISAFLLTIGVGNVWGTTYTWTLPWSTSAGAKNSSDGNASIRLYNSSGSTNGGSYTTRTGVGSHINVPSNGYFLISVPLTSSATSFTLNAEIYAWASSAYATKSVAIKYYSSKSNTAADVCSGSTSTSGCYSVSEEISLTSTYVENGTLYIKILPAAGNVGFESLSVTVSSGSCNANPSTGNASINGSFTLTSLTDAVSVSSGTWGAGSNCSWTDYGFVWGTSSSLSTTNNKVEVGTSGQATSWATDASHKVQPSGSTDPTSWSVGTTYYVKAYGKNGKAGATYYYSTNAASFTLRSITYNSNGGSTVNTQYVNCGGTYSAPTAPTKEGYTFGGWYTDNSTFENAMDWSSAISADKELYAKWTAKQCTVNFDIEGGTGTITSVTATYGQAMPSKESNLPTKTGYNFGGFWDGDGGTGTQYYNADGTSKINWNKDVTAVQTLYAKWTVQSYKVTWMVNGEEYTTGTPSSSVDFGSHVATLPTPPTPPCGNKFMGWTTTNIGSSGQATDAGLNLFTTAGGAPTISAEGDVTYYAVFADYAE